MEQVELRSSLLLVTGLELIREKLMQPQHGSISDRHVPESVDISVNGVRNSDLVETTLDELAEVLRERWRQPMIEAARRDRLVSCRVVAASEASECSALACGEAEHERPYEDGNLQLPPRSTTPSSSACSSRYSEGNSVVSRRMILDEEALLDTALASSFLSKRSLDKLPLYCGSSLS